MARDPAQLPSLLLFDLRAGRPAERPDPALTCAWGQLLQRHRPAVVALCFRLVRSSARAEELAQDTLVVAWSHLDRYQAEGPFRSWLFGIARKLCSNALRKHGERLTEDGLADLADPSASVLDLLTRRERQRAVEEAAAACLDAQERRAIHLRYVEDLPVERISALLALEGASGARGLLQRCRRKLGRELDQRGIERVCRTQPRRREVGSSAART